MGPFDPHSKLTLTLSLEEVGAVRSKGPGLVCLEYGLARDHGPPCWLSCVGSCSSSMRSQRYLIMVAVLASRDFIDSAYDKVVAIAKAAGAPDERWVQAMKGVLWSIPIANYNCLRYTSCGGYVAVDVLSMP